MRVIRQYRLSIAYAVAAFAPFLIAGIRFVTGLSFGERGALAFFGLPVAIAALLGGIFPGMFAVAVGAAVGVIFFWPPNENGFRFQTSQDIFALSSFIINWTFVAVVCDIARRGSEAERASLESQKETENQYGEVLDRITDGFFTLDSSRKVTMANREMLTLLDVSSSDVLGRPVGQAFAGFLTPAMDRQIETAFQSGSPITNTVPVEVRKSHYQIRVFPTPDRETVAVFVQDVTAQVELDQTRVHALAEERAKRSDAEQRSRSKDDFVAMLSHELRTPMTSILGWTELLRPRMASDPQLNEGLASIERAAKVQAKLVNELLDMSRIVTGNLSLTMEMVDYGELISRVVAEQMPNAENEKRNLHWERPREVLAVRGDPLRLRQIVTNLVSNSLKFTEPGGNVYVSLQREGNVGTLIVRDDGVGIDADVLPIVFNRFMQGARTRTRKHGGLGIGLAIVHQLVEAHHGEVKAFSDGPGKGAKMTVRIPLIDSTGLPAQEEEDDFIDVDLNGRSLVLVEDDELTRRAVSEILMAAGAEVRATMYAMEAMQLIESQPPDVIVSDIGLPEIDGLTFIAMVRSHKNPDIAKIPAVALTAFAGQEDRDRALLSGFDAHFPKPIDIPHLIAKLAQLTPK